MTNRFMKDRENYSGFRLEVSGVKRRKMCLRVVFKFFKFSRLQIALLRPLAFEGLSYLAHKIQKETYVYLYFLIHIIQLSLFSSIAGKKVNIHY